jgi:hypothetical protein
VRLRILLDECVPARARAAFHGHAVKTVTESGWRSTKDGQLLVFAEKHFDVFLTVDQRLESQNQLKKFRLGFIIVRARTNSLIDFIPLFDELLTAATSVRPGEIIHIGQPKRRR